MDLRNLNTFIQVAELNSFSRAGERLGYSQPTVSVQIRQLEEELGIRLFDRIGHTVRLTDRGREVLSYAQSITHMCQQMTQESGRYEGAGGTVRLAMADSLCSSLMDRGFSGFRQKHPNISLTLAAAGTGELFRMLDQNEADLICTLDNHIYNTNYVIASEEKIGVHIVVSRQDPLAGKGLLEREDLVGRDFLLTEGRMSYRRLLEEWLARDSMEIRPVLETSGADLICALVEQGIGIAFLPDYVTQGAVDRGTVVRLNIRGFEPELWKQLLYHRDKWISQPMRAVMDHFSKILLAE